MNVSMQDAFNLGWKLAAVIRNRVAPQLLHTYSAERQRIAKELIDFDREWAQMLSASEKSAGDRDAAQVQSYFVKQGRYTAGTATHYHYSIITAEPANQHLAKGFVIGTRFHSAPVIRFADAKPVHLGHVAEADGRWRIFAFADRANPGAPESGIAALCAFLGSSRSPIMTYTPAGEDIDSVFDLRAIFQQSHHERALESMPALLLPQKGRYGLHDYEKIFCPDVRSGSDIFETRGIDRDRGCMVVVRPDQYVANVLALDDYDGLTKFFDAFMVPAKHAP
jgi:phenol 2-monooxygenase